MSSSKYLLVIDTNVLHREYDEKADFFKFQFSSIFERLVEKIEELDIYENITFGVPQIVWDELIRQVIQAHDKKMKEIKRIKRNYNLPFCEFSIQEGDYKDYVVKLVDDYKRKINNGIMKTIDLRLPSEKRFFSIVDRALDKREPFEGVDSISDKGFKDALIWESILEFKETNRDIKIILFTGDKRFGEELKNEFLSFFNEEIIIIRQNRKGEIFEALNKIAIEINNSDHKIYFKASEADVSVEEWIYSDELKQQFIEFEPELVNNKDAILKDVLVLDVEDISSVKDQYQIDLIIKAEFLINETCWQKNYSISMLVVKQNKSLTINDLFVNMEVE